MFGKKKEAAPVAEPVVEEVPSFKPSGKTVIGSGIVMEGDFETKEPIIINGTIKGDIISDKDVFVSKDGSLFGNCKIEALTVEGVVDGNIECRGVAHIASTGKVSGSLLTSRLVTDDGSGFDGKLAMITAAPAEPKKAEE